MENTLENAKKAFNNTPGHTIYGRMVEKKRIEDFINTEDHVLHITGKPGTGKSCTVRNVLKNIKYAYVNYYHERKIGSLLKNIKENLVVIDEFDRYFSEKKGECMKYLSGLKQTGKKVITISNNLKMGDLKFVPYNAFEIKQILLEKINNEIGQAIIADNALTYLSKKFEKSGDLRLVFKFVFEILNKMENDSFMIKVTDLFNKSEIKTEKNVHHEIIMKIIDEGEKEVYSSYLKECSLFNIPILTKQDFEMVYEMHQ